MASLVLKRGGAAQQPVEFLAMRSIIPAVAGLAALCGATAANAATLSIDTDVTGPIIRGETFDVTLNYDGDIDEILSGYLVDVFFDEVFALLDVSFVDPDLGFNPLVFPGGDDDLAEFGFDDFGDAATVFGISGNTDGQLLDNQPLSFTFATLTFEAARVGSGEIGIDVFYDLFGIGGDNLDVVLGNDFLSLVVDPVPLPGALLFMATGLAGVAARRKLAV